MNTRPIIRITSFGYLHGPAPMADVTLDLRRHFRDPHVSPEMRSLTALDQAVRVTVLNTPGIKKVIEATLNMVSGYLSGPSAQDVYVSVGCAGGRHRAASVAIELAEAAPVVWGRWIGVVLVHRDLHLPVVER